MNEDETDKNLLSEVKVFTRKFWSRNDNTLQYSCLENSMARGAWPATVYGLAKSQK